MKTMKFNRVPRALALAAGIAILGAGHLASASTATVGPDIAFAQQDGSTIQAPANGLVYICANFSDAADLRNATISGGSRSAIATFSAGTHSACLQLLWSTRYVAAGDYTFRATVADAGGKQLVKTLTVHLVK